MRLDNKSDRVWQDEEGREEFWSSTKPPLVSLHALMFEIIAQKWMAAKSFPQTFFCVCKKNWKKKKESVPERKKKCPAKAIIFPSKSSTSTGRPSGNEISKTVRSLFPIPYFFFFCSGEAAARSYPISQNPQKTSSGKVHRQSVQPGLLRYFTAIINTEMKPQTQQSWHTFRAALFQHLQKRGFFFFPPASLSLRLRSSHFVEKKKTYTHSHFFSLKTHKLFKPLRGNILISLDLDSGSRDKNLHQSHLASVLKKKLKEKNLTLISCPSPPPESRLSPQPLLGSVPSAGAITAK